MRKRLPHSRLIRVCACAPSNSDVVFLLSQVSHPSPILLHFSSIFPPFFLPPFALSSLHFFRSDIDPQTTRCFSSNDTLFSIKRYVVFSKTTRRFSSNITSFSLLFEPISRISLNECYKDVANHCSIVFYNNLCDTCDSKNIKTPGMRARMRTRECTFKICLLSYFCPLFLHHFSISLSVKT